MLGDRHGRHLQLGRAIEHFLDAARAIEQRVFGVQVEVDEGGHRQCSMCNAQMFNVQCRNFHASLEG
jgi:hypothetical protein